MKYSFSILFGVFLLVNAGNSYSQKNISVVEITSSLAGDRLNKKEGLKFIRNGKSNLPTITIADSIHYQKMEGFGGTFNEAGMICLNTLSPADRDKVFRSLFDTVNGAGFNLMKSPMASCDYASAGPWYSYNESPGDTAMVNFNISRDLGPNGLITYIKKAQSFGKFRIETTMDFAPDWMMYGLDSGLKKVKPEYYDALAKYYSRYIQEYAAHGIQIGWLNPFNESDHNWYSNMSYKEIGELIKNHIVPRFRNDGLTTQIQLCESSSRLDGLRKFPVVLDDNDARKHISALTVHGYDWTQFSILDSLHKKYANLPIWMTEVCYALPDNVPDNGPVKLPVYEFSDGEFWGNMIMNDMKHWVCGWIYWNMILDETGGPWMVSEIHGDPENNFEHPIIIINRKNKQVSYTGLYYYLSHFSRFIKPGAYRIGTMAEDGADTLISSLNFAGFLNPDHSIVVNVINNGSATKCKVAWKDGMIIQPLQAHSITTLIWKAQK